MSDNDEIKREWMDHARISFQALRLFPGDIVAVNLPPNIAYEQMYQVAEMVGQTLPEGVTAMILTDGVTAEVLTDEKLAELGLQRTPRH